MLIVFNYIDSPKEKILKQEKNDLKENYDVMQDRLKQLELQMTELERRDNNVYRSIFEATPIPDSARVKDIETKKEVKLVQSMGENDLVSSVKD